MDGWYKALEHLIWVTQLGFSLLVPPVACLWFCQWLHTAHGVGAWVYLPGLLLGFGGGGMTFYKFAKQWLRRTQAEKKRSRPQGFNQH